MSMQGSFCVHTGVSSEICCATADANIIIIIIQNEKLIFFLITGIQLIICVAYLKLTFHFIPRLYSGL